MNKKNVKNGKKISEKLQNENLKNEKSYQTTKNLKDSNFSQIIKIKINKNTKIKIKTHTTHRRRFTTPRYPI